MRQNLNDEDMNKGLKKDKVGVFEGHTNFDMMLRGEMHTAHHRAQAIGSMRLKDFEPPGFGKFNKW
jgi:hypothetical protein